MNLDELQSVQSRERQTDSLQQLRGSFYEEAGRFIQQLREERENVAEQCDDPFDAPDVQRLTNEIKTAEQTVESIYERRIGKLVKQASLEAAGMTANAEGLTTEERETFDQLVSTIEENREHVLSVLANDQNTNAETTRENDTGDGGAVPNPGSNSIQEREQDDTEQSTPPETPEPTRQRSQEETTPKEQQTSPTDPEDSIDSTDPTDPVEAPSTGAVSQKPSAADMMGNGSETEAQDSDRPIPPESQNADHDQLDADHEQLDTGDTDGEIDDTPGCDEARFQVDRAMVKITRDVGKILCVDEREYDLSENDVVELPETNVGPLLANNAAERLD